MRTVSAASAKSSRHHSTHKVLASGSKLRAVYDLFRSNAGRPIDFKIQYYPVSSLYQLIDIYGLDIRRIRNGRWMLAGEWFGRLYVDHTAPKPETAGAGQ
jgi:hypothetical protein